MTEDKPEVKTPPIHTKYRPRSLSEVRGQDAAVKALQGALRMKARPHVYMFTGPAGTGKTTLALIVAAECGVSPSAIVEIDAASHSGVDDVRKLTESMQYQGFGDSPGRAVLVNECQALSKQAWDAFLDATERPGEHAFYLFTSTHPAKIPNAMVTRSQVFHLRPLGRDEILDELERVCAAEDFDTKGKVLGMVADACGGSMRGALTMLASVHALDDERDVADVLRQPLEDKEVIELCRLLVARDLTWKRLTETLKEMGDAVQPESVRIVAANYLAACLMGARTDRDAEDILFTLRQFATPFDPTTKLAPLLLAFGRVIFD